MKMLHAAPTSGLGKPRCGIGWPTQGPVWAASNAGVGPNVVIIAALPQGGFEPKVINAAGRTIDRNQ